jgi:hypothetical protein
VRDDFLLDSAVWWGELNMKRNRAMRVPALLFTVALLAALAMWPAGGAYAQGVTTSSIAGVVKDAQGLVVPGATVTAVHRPSGSTYETVTMADGRFSMPGMRIGGPYKVSATLAGFQPQTLDEVFLNLGVATDLVLTLKTVSAAEEVTVIGQSDPVFAANRTGAATTLSRETLASLPTISGQLSSVTRLTPQSGGGMSFVGQDSRMNNITVDGSYFNNSFGLGNTPGDRTGVAAISLAAVEQIQVNIAPFDVRQGNFVGAGVNTVTRSGTNQFRGSIYRQFRNEGMVGKSAKSLPVTAGVFTFGETGEWLAGPVLKNKLFLFQSYENEKTEQPGTTFTANSGGETVGGSKTRVLASDLDAMRTYLKTNFNYDAGDYQGYNFNIPGKRFLGKLDYNLGNRNKITLRYTQLDSSTDVLESNSNSLGNGNRRTSTLSMNFSNSNYSIMENIRSGIGQWNSVIGTSMANELIVGYTHQDESRGAVTNLFPTVDILDGQGATYMAFGPDPFTPNNELRYNTFQAQDNFTWFTQKHTVTFGATFEKYHSENVFFQGKASVYVFNTLADFYADANGYLANKGRKTAAVTTNKFQVAYMNVPGMDKPLQPLDVTYSGAYAQDEWSAANNLKVTAGVRFDVAKFGDTGFDNPLADAMTFRDEFGNPVQYNTKKLPDPKFLWSPRIGFNWDITSDRKTQVRGGTGVFTGKPAYVWISNQIGNTGVLTGLISQTNTTAYPFNPDYTAYTPKTPPTGAPAASYALAVTDKTFKFPQIWRSNIALDRKLFWGITSTTEFVYNRDVNGVYYINANLPAAQSAYTGADPRPRWVATGQTAYRLPGPNQVVTTAVVLKNQNVGRSWNVAQSITKNFSNGLYFKAAYSYGEAKNTVDPGSIAAGSWQNNPITTDPNKVPIGFSSSSPGHRLFVTASYTKEFLNLGATTVALFWSTSTIGNSSYVFAADANGDGNTSNDLIYIPRNTSEMNFKAYTSGGVTYSVADQTAAWEAYITQDKYLSKHRGEYAARGAVFYPRVTRLDLNVSQELFHKLGGARHGLAVRLDILNFGNMLNKNWGVSQRMVSNSPLTSPSVDTNGALTYTMRAFNNKLMDHTFEQTSSLSDVYSLMLSFRYTFN